eukprot:TRINITY_DN12314_c1_g4_i1.p1 TRINITY_DN12314_c1_g4~~TRINITY_DN12314_c1_g4_i1.p1  ORF type:complete len:546 (+),score=88.87 TRINITY_DN12314_c1_g4_i1:37-1674(+)
MGVPPTSSEDHYRVLGIRAQASAEDIKKAYKQLALRHHPDRQVGGGDTTEMFKRIASAYQVLVDPRQRQKYDSSLSQKKTSSPNVRVPTELRPTRPIRRPFVSECVDGFIRTFDIDPSIFPCSLAHGDQVIVSGETGVILGICDDAVWWWRNNLQHPSRLALVSQFNGRGLNSLQWRRTGNVFQTAVTRDRVFDLERRRLDSLRKFKQQKTHKEKQDAKLRKTQTQKQKLSQQIEGILSKEQRKRHRMELELLLQLQEVISRGNFEGRVTSYWIESRSLINNLIRDASDKLTPLSKPSSAFLSSDEILQDAFDDMLCSSTTIKPADLSSSIRSTHSNQQPHQLRFSRSGSAQMLRSPSRTRSMSQSPPVKQRNRASSMTFKMKREKVSLGGSQGKTKVAWKPPPMVELDSDESSLSSTCSDESEDEFELLSTAWCNDKLYADYRAFLSNSRVLRENWEKGASLMSELSNSKLKDATPKSCKPPPKSQKEQKGAPTNAAKRALQRSPKGVDTKKSVRSKPTSSKVKPAVRGLRPCSPGTYNAHPNY